MTGPQNPSELLDVDMDQLARVATLIAIRWLRWLQSRAFAQSLAQQHRRDRRERHRQPLSDLRSGQAQLAQLTNRRHTICWRLVRDPPRWRAPVSSVRCL